MDFCCLLNDGDELIGLQRGTSNQPAIDVGLREDFGHAIGLHTPPVLDNNFLGDLRGK